jgi:hypothetical protein
MTPEQDHRKRLASSTRPGRRVVRRARRHPSYGITECLHFFWGDAWLQRCHDDLDQATDFLDQAVARISPDPA